jgi:hypothetical protein
VIAKLNLTDSSSCLAATLGITIVIVTHELPISPSLHAGEEGCQCHPHPIA